MPTPARAAMTESPDSESPAPSRRTAADGPEPGIAAEAEQSTAGADPTVDSMHEPPSQGASTSQVLPPGRAHGAVAALSAAVADNLLLALVGPALVLIFGFSLYTINDRFAEINDRFAEMNDRFAEMNDRFAEMNADFNERLAEMNADFNERFGEVNDRFLAIEAGIDRRFDALEQEMNAKFAAQDAKIDALDDKVDTLDDKIDEVDLRLATLTAVLGRTDDVEAALDGPIASSVAGAAPR